MSILPSCGYLVKEKIVYRPDQSACIYFRAELPDYTEAEQKAMSGAMQIFLANYDKDRTEFRRKICQE